MAFDFESFGSGTTQPTKPGSFNFNEFGTAAAPKKKQSTLGKIGEFVTGGKFGQNVAQATYLGLGGAKKIGDIQNQYVDNGNRLLSLANKQKDVNLKAKYAKMAQEMFAEAGVVDKEVVGDIRNLKQQAGDTLGLMANLASVGIGGKAVQAGTKAAGLGTQILQGAKTGAIGGAAFGGTQGVATGLQQDKGILDIAKSGATGALAGGITGGLVGGVIPVAVKGVEKVAGGVRNIATRPARKAAEQIEQASMIERGIPDASIAGKTLESGKVVKDRVALEAIKQGIDEKDVAFIKSSDTWNKGKYAKMLDIAEAGTKNKLKNATERSADVAGESFLNQVRGIEKVNMQARKNLDAVANSLKGKKVSLQDPINDFVNELSNSGVKMTKKGKLVFKGSDYEGITGAQKAINNLWTRVKPLKDGSMDALQAHRLKRYIDNIVDYGKKTEGLSGKAETVLKGFRKGTDGILDTTFPAYNKVNSTISATIEPIKEVKRILGRVPLNSKFADTKAGGILRAVLSNQTTRGEKLAVINKIQEVAKEYGVPLKDDVVRQALFADVIENVFGSEASTSLLGNLEKGLRGAQQTASIMEDLSRGRVVGAGIRGVTSIAQHARGINQANKVKALRAILGKLDDSGGTVFGQRPFKPGGIPPTIGQQKVTDFGKFERARGLSFNDQVIEKKAFNKILKNEDDILETYKNAKGKVVNVDDFRPVFKKEGYKGTNSFAVQEPASYLGKRMWVKNLSENPEEFATLYAGGGGSGKSSGIKTVLDYEDLKKHSAGILDGNLSKIKSANERINEAISYGKTPQIIYVYREPLDAFENGVVKRMLENEDEMGRLVPISALVENHTGSLKTVKELYENADIMAKQLFTFIDNSDPRGPKFAKEMTFDEMQKITYPENLKELLLKKAKELYDRGKINKEQYEGYIK